RKFGQKRFLAVRRSWRGNGVACFWATSLEKIFGGGLAIISFRPGGRMQQSAVPRCAILSVPSYGRHWHGAHSSRCSLRPQPTGTQGGSHDFESRYAPRPPRVAAKLRHD